MTKPASQSRVSKVVRAKSILQVLAVPVGFELDCLVAERVMGWKRVTVSPGTVPVYLAERSKMYESGNVYPMYRTVGCGFSDSMFQPSSYTGHAQEAAMKCGLTLDEIAIAKARFFADLDGTAVSACEILSRACLLKVAGLIPEEVPK